MRLKLSIALLFTITLFIIGQEQRLGLNQIIDSAFLKHPKLANARLSKDWIQFEKRQSIDIGRTEIIYQKGYLYSNTQGSEFEVRQNLGSPFSWKANMDVANQKYAEANASFRLLEKQVVADIKKAYYECVFRDLKYRLLKQQQGILLNLLHNDSITLIDTTFALDRILMENMVSDALSRTDMAFNDMLIAENNLVRVAFLDNETIPLDTTMEMYQLIPASDTATRTPARLYMAAISSNYQIQKARLKQAKSQYFPQLFVGYKTLDFAQQHNLSSWQVGITVPLVFTSQSANVNKARNELLQAENDQRWQETEVQATASNLMVLLNKDFERLNYFYNYALEQSARIEAGVEGKIKRERKSCATDFQNLIKAFEIKLDYFETLNRYNQNAIALEVYAY
jgi:cobalt-zinc-cadmium resistance protein CzcA